MEDYIKLLELPEEFDLADLKKAYRKKVLKYHPDKASNEAERIGYEALMRKLNEANEYLKEYLENHGGKYTKSSQNHTYSYSNDNCNDEAYQEETCENQEENSEEYYEESYENEDEEVNQEYREEYEPQKGLFESFMEGIKEGLEKQKRKTVKQRLKELLLCYLAVGIMALIFRGCDGGDYTQHEQPKITQEQQETIQQQEQQGQEIQEETQEEQENNIDNTDNISNENKELSENPDSTTEIDAIKQPNWGPYMIDLQQRIKRNWYPPKGSSPSLKDIIVTFEVAKDGTLLSSKIKQSSGSGMEDRAALKAIYSAAPFDPLPPECKKESVTMDFTFEKVRPVNPT